MAHVLRLDDTLVSQIAAGEVIERPASVVKELVENALDAGATRIEVELAEGGLGEITVIDNGCGMLPADAQLALERHATSKIRAPEDLFAISTMGFRGEALPSIASVSRFELTTRDATSEAGTRLVVTGGARGPVEQCGAALGTRISVRELFFNQPARRKFQKSPATEQSHCSSAVLRIALAYSGVHFTVRSRGRVLLDVPAQIGADGRERIALGLGKEIGQRLYPFHEQRAGLTVSGFAADPEVQSGDARQLYCYVNRRFVRDRLLTRAVNEGYRSLLPHGRYPTIVLFVDLPGGEVDVNVHPQKFEVRFRQGEQVFGTVLRTLAETLSRTPWLEQGGGTLSAGKSRQAEIQQALNRASWQALANGSSYRSFAPADRSSEPTLGLLPAAGQDWVSEPFQSTSTSDLPVAEPTAARTSGFFSGLRIIGQYSLLYILCERDGELVLVDQHAAHERITFEKLMTAFEQGQVPEQRLLFPLTLSARPDAIALVEERASDLARLGLEIKPFGDATLAMTSIPAVTSQGRAKVLAEEIIAELSELGERAAAEFAHQLLARVACHAAVRSGDALSMSEMQALLTALDDTDSGVRCPHGRPVVARLSRESIGRWFERP